MSEIIETSSIGLNNGPDLRAKTALFAELSGTAQLVSGDVEEFESGQSYANLLENMQRLAGEELVFSGINAAEAPFNNETGFYPVTIDLAINNEPHTIIVSEGRGYPDVVDAVNGHITGQGGKRLFFFVEPYTKENVDQAFYLAFISQQVYDRLTEKGFTHLSLTGEELEYEEENFRLDVEDFFSGHAGNLRYIGKLLDDFKLDEGSKKLFLIPEEIAWLDTINGKIKTRSQLTQVQEEATRLCKMREDIIWVTQEISLDFDRELAVIYERIEQLL